MKERLKRRFERSFASQASEFRVGLCALFSQLHKCTFARRVFDHPFRQARMELQNQAVVLERVVAHALGHDLAVDGPSTADLICLEILTVYPKFVRACVCIKVRIFKCDIYI